MKLNLIIFFSLFVAGDAAVAPDTFVKQPLEEQCACKTDYHCMASKYCPNKCLVSIYTGVGTCVNDSEPNCSCNSDFDCLKSKECPNKCVFNPFSRTGRCEKPPPTRAPTPEPTAAPTAEPTDTCGCQRDYDCIRSPYCPNTCILDRYGVGTCEDAPPTPEPTREPTPEPTLSPVRTGNCHCESDYDCRQSPYCENTCIFPYGSNVGTCGTGAPAPTPTECFCNSDEDCKQSDKCPNTCVLFPNSRTGSCQDEAPEPTKAPTGPCCPNPRTVPTECEVDLLIQLMDEAVVTEAAIAAQLLRLAFHDAGTFNQGTNVGGANGCLLTHFPMRGAAENHNLDLALETLLTIKNTWEGLADTCIAISSADMIQFAGFFVFIRQKDVPGLNAAKIDEIKNDFKWERPDETSCQTSWTDNLPGFENGAPETDIPQRCVAAGGEIQKKMILRNGFSPEEATALMGAHSIGMTRNIFGSGDQGVWVDSGRDNATPEGPIFGNGFHDFLVNTIVPNTVAGFDANRDPPFDEDFPDWFQDNTNGINYLDTDVVLAFPSEDLGVHPHFHGFTNAFAGNNVDFLAKFKLALDKMSKLGVSVPLSPALSCDEGCSGEALKVTDGELEEFARDLDDSIFVATGILKQNEIDDQDKIKARTTPVEKETVQAEAPAGAPVGAPTNK